MLAMALAGALSTGGKFLNWTIPRPVHVLYVDGELPDAQIQERIRQLHASDAEGRPCASISLVTSDSTPGGIPSLATAEGQQWIEAALTQLGNVSMAGEAPSDPRQGPVEYLILDSLSSLAPFATNDEDLWIPYRNWIMRLRSRGLCIFELHQAGKLGQQRGHSRGDDALDVQIKLEPKDAEADHLDCELTYEKIRGPRAGARALHVEFSNAWKWTGLEADNLKILEEYQCLHPTAGSRTIARDLPELGSYKAIQRLMKKANHS